MDRSGLPVADFRSPCIAIGAALRWELESVLGALRRHGAIETVGPQHWRGFAGVVQVHVYRTGVGVRAARRSTARILRDVPASLVLNTGCAGALDDGWSAGDLAIATTIVGPPPECSRWQVAEVAAALGDRIGRVAATPTPSLQQPRPARFATSRLPLLDSQQKRDCRRALDAEIVDMEGAGVAAAAARAARAVASVRAILDPLDLDLPAPALLVGRRRELLLQVARGAVSLGEIRRGLAVYRNQRSARRSLAAFHAALFASLAEGDLSNDALFT